MSDKDAPREPAEIGAYTIKEFCAAFRLSVPMFYKLRERGDAPDVMKVGARTLVSIEAVERWRRQRERAARSPSKKKGRGKK
jgi:hypothetical protein